jgi:hypothetical protein
VSAAVRVLHGARLLALAAPLLLLALLGLGLGCGGSRTPGSTLANTPLQLKRVVLYRNGVGYFERHGKVQGKELRLKVRKDQINDLLKSLAIVDRSKGKALGVSIPLDPQGFHKLAIAALAPGQGQLAQVLDALRGTKIRVRTKTRTADGRIVMVERLEAQPQPPPPPLPEPRYAQTELPQQVVDHKLTLLDGDEIEVVLLSEIESLTIEDADVVMQLHRRLDASAGEGMFQQVELTLRLSGSAEHDLVVSYVAPAPLWKPTYRLVLDDKQPGQALLQAWAVVDNTSGESWTDVQLSLTSGAPIAFQYDLHTPREVERPDMSYSAADKRAQVAIGEQTYGGDADAPAPAPSAEAAPEAPADEEQDAASEEKMERKESADLSDRMRRSLGKSGAGGAITAPSARPMPARAPAAPPPPSLTLEALAQSAAASTRAARVAGLTRFDLTDRVTLPDGSATMVALVNQLVTGEQVFLFKPGGSGQGYESNPYRVVRFRNDTDFVLEPGPISIYASGSFVGEGLSEAISSRDTATIPFAVEPSILVQSKVDYGGEELRTVKLVRGVLEVERYQRVSTEWRVTGPKDSPSYKLLVRHPRQGGSYELVSPKVGVEQLPDAYLVPLEIARGAREATLKVVEQTPVRMTVSIWDGEAEKLLDTLLSATNLDAAMRAKLEPIVQKRRELGRVDTEIAGLEAQRQSLDQRVAETRESLRAMQRDPRAGALRKRLGERLDGFLKEADAAGRKVVELQSKRLELKIALEDLLARDGDAAPVPPPPPDQPIKPTR